MKRYEIKRLDGTIGWSAEFEADSEAQDWIALNRANGSWGSAAEHSIVVTDLTAERAAEKQERQDRKQRLRAAKAVLASAGTLTAAQTKAILKDMVDELGIGS